MPHVLLVVWLHEDKVAPYLKDGTYEYNEKLPSLIDHTITCELPQDSGSQRPADPYTF